MRVGLVDVDSKIPNLALMKLSAYHKGRGDTVEWHMPIAQYDLVYGAKIFGFTPDYQFYPENMPVIKGGSGYDLKTCLPAEVESQYPDYSLYNCDYAIGFTTRGCIRKCPFCVVPEKEGNMRAVSDIHSFWRGQRNLLLLDNNFTAASWEHFEATCNDFIKHRIRVDFSGVDIRLLTDDHAALLARVSLWKQLHFAFDFLEHEQAVRRGVEILRRHMPLSRAMFYVLIGYNTTPEEDLYRVELLRGLGVDPFVMPYNKRDKYQRRFARWVNHKAIFKTVPWDEYK